MAAVLILAGPTASGKTELALALAERFGAEIVGADSRQIYRGMPIGTAAPTAAQRARVPHHLVEFLDPRERYSAARYVRDARRAIDAIAARGRRVIVAGGTGFYLRALAGDVALDAAYDPAVRARLAAEARIHPPDVLAAWLAALAPERAAQIAPNDPYRIARALEVALTGTPPEREALPTLRADGIPFVKLVLETDPGVLTERIERRVDGMLAAGLLEEAERVGSDAVAADAVGYREALAFLAGFSTAPELRAQLIRSTRRYAKRQATWFRSEPDVVRVRATECEAVARERLGWA
ncbi:MAG TPA: tRNA (adenosine(37)-N6)-dimethylallyltransferase MiaA [Candidatus Lustribacter sp.]|jgi:tRNA dimethylallyltransferase|nr:tRNA (adenosine(37)-N6)-dimethylallyltransferase MiaA [Candidatus Lustribacter sp.]